MGVGVSVGKATPVGIGVGAGEEKEKLLKTYIPPRTSGIPISMIINNTIAIVIFDERFRRASINGGAYPKSSIEYYNI
jgi:hypothetical protein